MRYRTYAVAVLTAASSLMAIPSAAPEPVHGDAARYIKQLTPREYARAASRSRSDYNCLVKLWTKESNWRHTADNPKSSAYGIAQLLGERSKNPYRQVDNGLKYIKHRYGSACEAWSFWQRNGWY